MNFNSAPHPIDILLVEDNAADVRPTEEVFSDSKVAYVSWFDQGWVNACPMTRPIP